jgi:hypothetical protein
MHDGKRILTHQYGGVRGGGGRQLQGQQDVSNKFD